MFLHFDILVMLHQKYKLKNETAHASFPIRCCQRISGISNPRSCKSRSLNSHTSFCLFISFAKPLAFPSLAIGAKYLPLQSRSLISGLVARYKVVNAPWYGLYRVNGLTRSYHHVATRESRKNTFRTISVSIKAIIRDRYQYQHLLDEVNLRKFECVGFGLRVLGRRVSWRVWIDLNQQWNKEMPTIAFEEPFLFVDVIKGLELGVLTHIIVMSIRGDED